MLISSLNDKLKLKILIFYLLNKKLNKKIFFNFFFFFFKINFNCFLNFFQKNLFFKKKTLDEQFVLNLDDDDFFDYSTFLENTDFCEFSDSDSDSDSEDIVDYHLNANVLDFCFFFRKYYKEQSEVVSNVILLKKKLTSSTFLKKKIMNVVNLDDFDEKITSLSFLNEFVKNESLDDLELLDFLKDHKVTNFFYKKTIGESIFDEKDDFLNSNSNFIFKKDLKSIEDDESDSELNTDFYNFFFFKKKNYKNKKKILFYFYNTKITFNSIKNNYIEYNNVFTLNESGKEAVNVDSIFYLEFSNLILQEKLKDLFEQNEENLFEANYFYLFFNNKKINKNFFIEDDESDDFYNSYFTDFLNLDSKMLEDESSEFLFVSDFDIMTTKTPLIQDKINVLINSDLESNFIFKKNFLPFFFFLKKINTFFFLKTIFNFFFFFLPTSFFFQMISNFKQDYFLYNKDHSYKSYDLLSLNSYRTDFLDVLLAYKPVNTEKKKNTNFFFFLFLSKFFNLKFKENISISLISTKNLEKENELFLLKNLQEINLVLKSTQFVFDVEEFLNMFFLCLQLKDLTSLAIFIKNLFEKIQIKFHKIFLVKLDIFINSFFRKFKKKFKIKGFFMDIRGKVSVVGNSKKRHVYIKKGYLSKSKKSLKFFFYKNQINTNTGVLGASYLLSY